MAAPAAHVGATIISECLFSFSLLLQMRFLMLRVALVALIIAEPFSSGAYSAIQAHMRKLRFVKIYEVQLRTSLDAPIFVPYGMLRN